MRPFITQFRPTPPEITSLSSPVFSRRSLASERPSSSSALCAEHAVFSCLCAISSPGSLGAPIFPATSGENLAVWTPREMSSMRVSTTMRPLPGVRIILRKRSMNSGWP